MCSSVEAVDIFNRVIKQNVIHHHLALLAEHRIFRPTGQQSHGAGVFFDVVRRVVFALSVRRGDLDPIFDVFSRFGHVFSGRFPVIPKLWTAVWRHLSHQILADVIHDPVVFGISPIREIALPEDADKRLLIIRERGGACFIFNVLRDLHEQDHRDHPKHRTCWRLIGRDQACFNPFQIRSFVEIHREVKHAASGEIRRVGERHGLIEEVLGAFAILLDQLFITKRRDRCLSGADRLNESDCAERDREFE